MTGRFYIDGNDAFLEYKIFVREGGFCGLVQYPPLKTIDKNDWPEEDGIEPDLSSPKLNTKTFEISFAGTESPLSEGFIFYLSDGAYHVFDFPEIGVSRRLRLVNQPDKRTTDSLETFKLQFADDFPLDGYEYKEAVSITSVWQTGYEIDEIPLSNYGVWVIQGSDDDIMKSPSVKENLIINAAGLSGAVYDKENVIYGSKDVNIKCHLKADIETFWRNYNALLCDLIQPGERKFFYEKRYEEYKCYYKNSTVSNFTILRDEIWCEFTLNLTFTSFRVTENNYLLAGEDNYLLLDEEEQNCFDMKDYGNN